MNLESNYHSMGGNSYPMMPIASMGVCNGANGAINYSGAPSYNQMGVEALPVQEPIPVEYTEYKDLPNYSSDVNMIQVLEWIKIGFENKKDWKDQFAAINHLRIINKYYPNDMNEIFRTFWPQILAATESVRSNIEKNLLVFLKEVFANCTGYQIFDEIITGVAYYLLQKTQSEKKFVKLEAEAAIEMLVTTCLYDSTVLAMCRSCFDKNSQICELSLRLLAKCIENMCGNLTKLKDTTIQDLFITLGRLLDGKRQSMQTFSQKICIFLVKLIGLEAYRNCLQALFTMGSLSEAEAKNCLSVLETKSRRVSDLKEVKKEMKKRVSVMRENYMDVDEIYMGNGISRNFRMPSDITNYQGGYGGLNQSAINTCNGTGMMGMHGPMMMNGPAGYQGYTMPGNQLCMGGGLSHGVNFGMSGGMSGGMYQ